MEPALVESVVELVAGEARELPDEDDVVGFFLAEGVIDHLLEFRAVADQSALGFVDVDPDDDDVVAFGERFALRDLGFNGVVDVLAVAGYTNVYRGTLGFVSRGLFFMG